MANVVLVLVLLVLSWLVLSILRNRGRGVVSRRGTGAGADLAALADQPRVWVVGVKPEGPDRVRVSLTPVPHDADQATSQVVDSELLIALGPDEFGFGLLHEWQRTGAVLAIVMPHGSRIVRLRSIDDLQPVTLRRVDE